MKFYTTPELSELFVEDVLWDSDENIGDGSGFGENPDEAESNGFSFGGDSYIDD